MSPSVASKPSPALCVALSSVGGDYVPLLQAIRIILQEAQSGLDPSLDPDRVQTYFESVVENLSNDIDELVSTSSTSDRQPGLQDAQAILCQRQGQGAAQALETLALEQRRTGFRCSALSGILFCTVQVGNYLLHHRTHDLHARLTAPLSTASVLPFCGGLLSAYAISQAESANQLVELGVKISRMAFWMGLQSDRAAALHARDGDLAGSWTLAIMGWSAETLQPHLERIHAGARSADGDDFSLGLQISAATQDDVFSISGPPILVDALEMALKADANATRSTAGSPSKKLARVPIYTPYHSREAMAEFVPAFFAAAERLDLFTPRPSLQCRVFSTLDGTALKGDNISEQELVEAICLAPCRWDKAVDTYLRETFDDNADASTEVDVVNVGPAGRLGHATMKNFENRKEKARLIDLEQSTMDFAQGLATRAASSKRAEPIAIVGHACRFPQGANTPELFYKMVEEGQFEPEKIPPSRFNVNDYTTDARPNQPNTLAESAARGYFISDVDRFDAKLFSISPREAEQTDPQHRLIAMVSHEALERAGYARDKTPAWARSRIGTFVATASDDYRDHASADIGSFLITGNARAFMPGRVSFVNDWSGPSASVDAGDMSSGCVLETACDALWAGKCDAAVTGAVAVHTSPAGWITAFKAGLLPEDASDLRSRRRLRAEGCAVVVLKRLSQALEEGDTVLATIEAVASNYCSNPALTDAFGAGGAVALDAKPRSLEARLEHQVAARAAVLTKALAAAGVGPGDVDIVERNDSGFELDEQTELQAIDAAALRGRARRVGSAKAAMGDAAAASGMAALFRVIGALQGRKNDCIAVINDYSLAGGNTSIVVRSRPALNPEVNNAVPDLRGGVMTFALSAKTRCALERQLQALSERIKSGDLGHLSEEQAVASVCYTATDRRSTVHPFRVAGVVSTLQDVLELIGGTAVTQSPPASKVPRIAFFFSGQGAQYPGMARRLAECNSVFASTLRRCEEIVTSELGFPGFLEALLGSGNETMLDDATTQYAIFAIEYALAATLQAVGVAPAVVAGHSLGEYAALAVAQVLSLRDALFLVATRAHLLLKLVKPRESGMLSVIMTSDEVSAILGEGSAKGCEIACENGPKSTVISGPVAQLDALQTVLKGRGIKTAKLGVSFGFHSTAVDPILPGLQEACEKVDFHRPQVPVLANATGELVKADGIFGPEYLCRHSRERVRFKDCIQALTRDPDWSDVGLGLEVGPDAILLSMVRDSVADVSAGGSSASKVKMRPLNKLLPTMKKGKDEVETLSHALTGCYLAGINVDWYAYNEAYIPSALRTRWAGFPTYSFDLDRFWLEYKDRGLIKPGAEVLVHERGQPEEHKQAFLPRSTCNFFIPTSMDLHPQGAMATFQLDVTPTVEAMITGHKVSGVALVPAALSAGMCLEAAAYLHQQLFPAASPCPQLQLQNLHITGPLTWHTRDEGDKGDRAHLSSPRNPRVLVRCTADTSHAEKPIFSCMVSSERVAHRAKGNGKESAKSTSLHATCSVFPQGPSSVVAASFAKREALLLREVRRLQASRHKRDTRPLTAGTKLCYQLFSKVVSYSETYHALSDAVLTAKTSIAVAHLGKWPRSGHSPRSQGRQPHPLTLDAISQLAGLAANLFLADREHVYITESCDCATLLPDIATLEDSGGTVIVLATLRDGSAEEGREAGAVIVGDCYAFKEDEDDEDGMKLIAAVTGAKYGRMRTQGLRSVLRRTLSVT